MKKIVLGLFAFFCLNLTACEEQVATIGQAAPPLAAYDLNGDQASLADWKGRPVLLSFWSESCGVCINELKALEQAVEARQADIKLIAVNVDEAEANTQATVEKYQIKQLVLKDQLKMTAERYQIKGTPTSFLIDKAGVVQQKFEGKVPPAALQKIL